MVQKLLHGTLAALLVVAALAVARADAPVAPSPADGAKVIDTAGIALVDVATGRRTALRALAGAKATLVFFSSNECPVALAYEQELAAGLASLEQRGVRLVAVSSSYAATRDAIHRHRLDAKLPYPLYQDAGGKLAAALGATRTSEVVLLDGDRRVAYQGRIDDRVTPAVRRARATTHELADALDAVLDGHAVAQARTQAAGCMIARPRTAEPAARVTYADVAPILGKYCTGCHRPGEAGPMSLVAYDDAASWSDTIVEVLRENRMPPSKLSPPDPRYGEFVAAPEPTAAEIDTIAAWVDAGTPTGKAVAPAAPGRSAPGWAIGKPDLILSMPRPYSVPASGVVQYQYYTLLEYTGDERWVEAIEVRPGVRSVVHHANVYMAQSEIGTVGFDNGERWASFAPGRPPTTFPAGVARRLPRGAKLTLEVHYTPDGAPRDDRTTIGIRFTRTRPHYEARSILLGTLNFKIPPRAPDHEVTATYTLKGNGKIASFTPHMHDRGKDFRYEAILPDGTTRTLLAVPRYNFKWQFTYVPKDMIALPKGTVLKATAHYDNSAANPTNPDPDKTVMFGLQTFEEMMFGFVDLVYDEDVGSPNLISLRAADRESALSDRGFKSRAEFAAWARELQDQHVTK
ncbi:MAG: redoxin domain-containing protein [Deltaproteobacteria bacterium]|nr:MAG: redoxin domain-containing protein [Deltaproteobacteria bacterium]